MEAGSEGEINRDVNQSLAEGSKRPKRQMKTPLQLEALEKTYASMLIYFLLYSFCLCVSPLESCGWWLRMY